MEFSTSSPWPWILTVTHRFNLQKKGKEVEEVTLHVELLVAVDAATWGRWRPLRAIGCCQRPIDIHDSSSITTCFCQTHVNMRNQTCDVWFHRFVLSQFCVWKQSDVEEMLSFRSSGLNQIKITDSLTFVMSSGTGSNTLLCSSRGIWEWSGRIRYRLLPAEKMHQQINHCKYLKTFQPDFDLISFNRDREAYRSAGWTPGVSAWSRWGSSRAGRRARLRSPAASRCTWAELPPARRTSPSR